jgi:FkbM family methyltransferase
MRKLYEFAHRITPHPIKYAAMTSWQRRYPPFCMVNAGDTVVQVGVAGRLCPLGRSQPLIFSRLVEPDGRVIGFESIPENLNLFTAYAARHGISNVETRAVGLWKEKTVLPFDVPERSGSSRIMSGCTRKPFRFNPSRNIFCDTLDNQLSGLDRLDLLNLTTNIAEAEIVEGGMEIVRRFRPAICMIGREENRAFFKSTLEPMGYSSHETLAFLHVLGKSIPVLFARRPTVPLSN